MEIEYSSVFNMSDRMVDDLMVTALEGGINYWCDGVTVATKPESDYTYASDVISRGGTLLIHSEEGSITLSDASLKDGIQSYCAMFGKTPESLFGDYGDYDAGDADCIVQLAIFGTIIFG